MSFIDRERRASPASIAAVVLVHAAIGYAVVSGLAITVISHRPPVMRAELFPDDTQPPPPREFVPPRARTSTPLPLAQPIPDTIIKMPLQDVFADTIPVPSFPPSSGGGEGTAAREAKPAPPSLSRGAAIIGDRARWVTADDYPSSALRAGAEGITGILVSIGGDGRVTDCRVTASSGNDLLDKAACLTYARRARFRPALDEAGHPVATQRADRIRWQLPSE